VAARAALFDDLTFDLAFSNSAPLIFSSQTSGTPITDSRPDKRDNVF
jgi:hypothetical protein